VSTAAITAAPIKPRLRGRIHLVGALLAIPVAIWLGMQAQAGIYTLGAITYGASLFLLLATSGTYHTPRWSEKVRSRMQRLDRSMIFVLIAGSYTPFLLASGETARQIYLPIIWTIAVLGILRTIFLPKVRGWLTALPYVVMGWIAVPMMPIWIESLGTGIIGIIGAGGLLYTGGAVVYAFKRPDPWPRTFGYHEIFHAAVVLASALHCWAVWLVVA
jgi:hemolysin III